MQRIEKLLTDLSTKSILFIFPHPDDESFASGGLLLMAHRLGIATHLACMTRGEMGNSTVPKGTMQAQTRSEELMVAANILHISQVKQFDLPDSRLKDHFAELKQKVEELVKEIKPDLVVTYDHGGFTGHPDHIALSVATWEVCKDMKKQLLFYVPSSLTRKLVPNAASKYGSESQFCVRNFLNIPKLKALAAHKSQASKSNLLEKIVMLLPALFLSENYHLVDFSRQYGFEYFPFRID